MPDRISLNLPWPPCLNHYKQVGPIRRTKSGKLFQARVNTPETNKYYFHVNCLVRQNKLAEGLKFATDSTISVGASIYLYPPDRRRRDIDGVFKVLLDSLVRSKLLADDSQITRLYAEKMDIILIPGGQVALELYAIDDESEVGHAYFGS